jgi:nicotinate phosphoribosyltransferase
MSILNTIPGYRKDLWKRTTLSTDAYKFSMLAGGRPEEEEVFYLSFRKGGRLFMPVNLDKVIEELQPRPGHDILLTSMMGGKGQLSAEAEYLRKHGFPVNEAWMHMITTDAWVLAYATPQGEWADPREPVLTLRASQALASWLEPLLIGRISYQMQIATAALEASDARLDKIVEAQGDTSFVNTDEDPFAIFMKRIAKVTCEEQKRLTVEALNGAGLNGDLLGEMIEVDEEGYYNAVKAQCQKMLDTGVTPDRFFEVGLRAATCMDQHLIALKAMKDMGFTKTSNVFGAWLLDMIPVGTMGHEGVMRWGGDDELAFKAHQETLPRVTFLLDTNDTLAIGLPLAIKMMLDMPERMDGARPDSGDLAEQFRVFAGEMKKHNLARPWIFEDGLDDKKTAEFEALRQELDYPSNLTLYGAGGFFIDRPEYTGFTRGRINMIYKLSWTARFGSCMKFGNEDEKGESGKASIPGVPVTYVKRDPNLPGPMILVGQQIDVLPGYTPYEIGDVQYRSTTAESRPELSDVTLRFIRILTGERARRIEHARSET